MTSLFLPTKGVQYPVTILSQYIPAQGNSAHRPKAANLKQQSSQVERGTPLFAYTWTRLALLPSNEKGKERETEEVKETRVFESPIEGQVEAWLVSEGTVIDSPSSVTWSSNRSRAAADSVLSRRAILKIEEPCTHPVQLGGLCAICGKDLTASVGSFRCFWLEFRLIHTCGFIACTTPASPIQSARQFLCLITTPL